MAATTAAVVGAVVAVGSAASSSSARRGAARDASAARLESAELLEAAGRSADADILRSQAEALQTIALGAEEATESIQPFVEPGQEAFRQAQSQILSGAPLEGPLADSIRNASLAGVPSSFDTSGPVGQELQRQADISVSAAQPAFTQNLSAAAQEGIAATGDVSAINRRGLERFADIAASSGAQRASALIGSTPQLAALSQGAQEARLLSDVAGQQFRTTTAEEIAQLAGRVS